jgi:hypothetical protein
MITQYRPGRIVFVMRIATLSTRDLERVTL